ncbi:MAG: dienelactone hydrolase family protein [Anaerolineae bacterium]|nr:dienelactone hydrolase family protein [Anaerolineales bacterium]MCQ3971852.1 dienelactone hydrolase family protein [Anaerolineae bacterium]
MKTLNTFQKYFVEEFYDDYREGLLSRRAFIRRLVFITGSMAAAAATMSALGCAPAEVPDPTEPVPPPEPTATTAPAAPAATSEPAAGSAQGEAVPDAKSPLSVPEGDPAVNASDITLESQGAQISGYLARPAAAGTYAAILVCHENRGLTPHIRDVARRFAKAGYVALALDLLSREGGTASLDRDEVPGLLTDAGPERHVGDFTTAFTHLQGLEGVDGQRIGMTGFCFGGGITWRCATALPDLKAAVPFYGPAPELEQVPNIKAAVLGVYAEQDERINAGIEPLQQALVEANITHEIKIYPGVNHAFHNDTGERYNETQATQAWNDMLAWFETHLRQV